MNTEIDEIIEKLDGKIVSPGELIIENIDDGIIIGKGLTVVDNKIYSTVVGLLKVSKVSENKIFMEIIGRKEPIVPKKGDVILGEITNVSNNIASVRILFVARKKVIDSSERYAIYPLQTPFSGIIHISHAIIRHRMGFKKHERNEYLFQYLAIGDIVLGEIIADYVRPYSISIKDFIYGVVAAKCSRCGAPLKLRVRGKPTLYCDICKKEDPRKFSVLYDYEVYSGLVRLYKSRKYAYSAEMEW